MSDHHSIIGDVEKGRFSPVYYLCGEDEYPIQEIVKGLKAKIGAGPMAEFNVDEVSGESLSWDTLLERARTLPMMAQHRLVIGWGVDRLLKKSDEDGMAAMEGYFKSPSPETVLVFVAKVGDRRLKFFKSIEKVGVFFQSAHPKPAQVPGLIKRFAEHYGKAVDDEAAQALAELVGTEAMWIRNEVDKLCLYVGERKRITADDVRTVMADINLREVWALTEAMAKKDFALCMRLIDPLVRDGEPVMILGALANEVRKIAKTKQLMLARRGRDEIARETRVPPFALERILGYARAFTLDELSRIYRRLEATDIRLKRTAYPPRLVLESLLADICLG